MRGVMAGCFLCSIRQDNYCPFLANLYETAANGYELFSVIHVSDFYHALLQTSAQWGMPGQDAK